LQSETPPFTSPRSPEARPLYITFEASYSGMSINPARTVTSALPSGVWTAGWIYFVAPAGGMLLAVEIYRALRKGAKVACAKLNHHTNRRCIFCGFAGGEMK
jgi:aquaporin Z